MSKDIILPTLTLDQLDQYLNSNKSIVDPYEKATRETTGGSLLELLYDDDFVHDKLTRADESKIVNILKKYAIVSSSSEDGVLKKASKNDINAILNQATFGTTGTFIKLIHSGFGVKLRPMDAIGRSDFQARIANSIILVTRSLAGDLYTGVYAKIINEVLRVFITHLEYTTFDYPSKNIESILKYIKLKDLNLILLGILKLLYPDGYDSFKYICGEIVEKNIDGAISKNSCGVESDVLNIDMLELLYVDEASFTDFEISMLNNTTRSSIKLADVIKYQEGYKYNKPLEVKLTEELTFVLDSDSIDNYRSKSDEWLNKVIIEADTFSTSDIETVIRLVEDSAVGKYYYCINSIISNGLIIEKKDITVKEVKTLSTNPAIAEAMEVNAKSMLNNTGYLIAVPKYTCPSCLARAAEAKDEDIEDVEDVEVTDTDPNKDLITNVNLLDLFIYLV